jgi:hypothetical protein
VSGPLYLAQIEWSVVKAQPCNDAEPDNDFSDTAPLLAPIPQTCIGTFDRPPRGTDDLYKIIVNTQKTIAIDLNIPAGINATLALYDQRFGANPSARPLCVSRIPVNGSEHIVYPNAAPSTNYIGIFWRSSSALPNSYVLQVALENKPAACGH